MRTFYVGQWGFEVTRRLSSTLGVMDTFHRYTQLDEDEIALLINAECIMEHRCNPVYYVQYRIDEGKAEALAKRAEESAWERHREMYRPRRKA